MASSYLLKLIRFMFLGAYFKIDRVRSSIVIMLHISIEIVQAPG